MWREDEEGEVCARARRGREKKRWASGADLLVCPRGQRRGRHARGARPAGSPSTASIPRLAHMLAQVGGWRGIPAAVPPSRAVLGPAENWPDGGGGDARAPPAAAAVGRQLGMGRPARPLRPHQLTDPIPLPSLMRGPSGGAPAADGSAIGDGEAVVWCCVWPTGNGKKKQVCSLRARAASPPAAAAPLFVFVSLSSTFCASFFKSLSARSPPPPPRPARSACVPPPSPATRL